MENLHGRQTTDFVTNNNNHNNKIHTVSRIGISRDYFVLSARTVIPNGPFLVLLVVNGIRA